MPENPTEPALTPGSGPSPAPTSTPGGDLLLTTKDAESGAELTTPLAPFHDGGLLLVVASGPGAPHHPAWYRNLLAHPIVRVRLGAEEFQAVAVPAEGARHERLLARVVRADPTYGAHRGVLPLVVLERPEADGDTDADGAAREIRTFADKVRQVHDWLRAQLSHVRDETEAYFADGSRASAPGLGLQIRQHCLAFCQSLEFHHTSEDRHLFPGIARHHPHLGATFERLRDEHRTVARIQDELVALLADLATADPLRFRAELHRMSDELTAHLAYEEAELLPLLAEVPWPPAPPAPPSPTAS